MLEVLKVHATWNITRLYEISNVEGVQRNKNKHKRLHLRHLFLLSKVLKVLYTIYINRMKPLCRFTVFYSMYTQIRCSGFFIN